MKMLRNSAVKKILMIMLCSFIIGGGVSGGIALWNYQKSGEFNGKHMVEENSISCNKGVYQSGDLYYIPYMGGELELNFPKGIYINKIQYEYFVEQSAEKEVDIEVHKENVYGDSEIQRMKDNYFSGLSRSVININDVVTKIKFVFPKENNDIEIKNFVIDNSLKWNPYLFGVVSVVVFLILFLVLFRRENARKPELATFICTITLGMCLLVLQLPYCTGMDEEIHFERSYRLGITSDPDGAPNSLHYIIDNYAWLDFHHLNSVEEKVDFIKNVNAAGNITDGRGTQEYDISISSVGYIFQAGAITVGKFLGLPFYFVWLLGKFSNVLLYSMGMTVAVAIVPIGKRLLSVMAVLPTMIFTSTVYTYDTTVNVCIIIGICIFVKELLDTETLFSNKWRIIYFASMVIGCMPKAVYAPLVLNVLFLPKDKFKSSKDEKIFKLVSVLVFLVLMSTFVLPTLLSSSVEGDARGGNTSVTTQMSYVLGQPIAYAIVLLKNVGYTFVSYVLKDSFDNFAYYGAVTMPFTFSALLVGTALTDTYSTKREKSFPVKTRIVAMLSILATIVLIWTALYLSFTEVGETKIAGVQARYYLPFLFLFYLCFRTDKIKNNYKEENYQMVIMLIACGMLMYQIVRIFLVGSCL